MAIYNEESYIHKICAHYVGNKTNDEALLISRQELSLPVEIQTLLRNYFVSRFTSEEYFRLHHDADLSLNEVYSFASAVFDDPGSLYEQSVNLAKHLYEQSIHPKIKAGEFYVVHFEDCTVDGETVDAVGLFKSENKDTFLKVYPSEEGFRIESETGINLSKLDKGCMIYNREREDGYVVAIVDNTNKSAEARFWIDDFLHVRQRRDEYHNTQNVMALCKSFVTKEMPRQFDVSKADQAELLNKSVQFFKENDTFDMSGFASEVIAQPDVIESFNTYKSEYQQERDIDIADSFQISDSAVKKQARALKSVIKLDRNFHIYVHGDNRYIRKGYDEETGMHYYQLFFQDEQ